MKPPIFSPVSSIIQTCLQTIEDRAQCKTAVAENTRQDHRSSQQFSRYRNSPPRGQQRRSTVCPTELDRQNSTGRYSDSGSEEEKMLFEQRRRGRVSTIPGGKACRDLARGRIHRFVTKVSDNLPFRDILWRSAAFLTHAAEDRRRFGFPEKERRSQEDRWGLGWTSFDGHLLNAESLTSVERIRGHLSSEEALAWEGFSPLQRVLIVAIAGASAANFKRGVVIKPAERSLDDQDQSLNFMRHKLYNLLERISSFYDQSGLRNAGDCETCGQGLNDGLRSWKGKTGDADKILLDFTHAPCAVAILELKRRMEKMTEKEASNVMAAFASVLEKVEALEIYGSTQEGRHNKTQGVALRDLKISVEKALAQITSLQTSLFDMWHVLLPESLCTINISPSELEHYVDKVRKESCMLLPSRQFSIQAWRQWLNIQEHASEATFIPVPRDETEEDASVKMTATEQEERRLSDLSDWSSSVTSSSDHNISHPAEADVPSAIGAAVKKSMDKISAPLDAENSRSNGDSQELVVEKSLSKLEIASAKVANLELQLASLKDHLKLCEKKRKHSEEKLAEAVQQGIKNQLNFAAKEEEIACLRKECKQKDATIKEVTLAVQKSKDTSDKRLAISEDICKKNNVMIMRLKDDMVALEEKVNACLGKESKQKDAIIRERTLAQKLKVTRVKRLAVSEGICKKKNAMIMRLKDDIVSMEDKVAELKRFLTPLSSKFNGEYFLPLVMSYNPLFDNMVMPSSPDSRHKDFGLKTNEDQYLAANEYKSSSSQGCNETRPDSRHKDFGLKTNEDQYLAANEYVSSSSQGCNETQQRSYVKFRRNSTGTQAHKITKLGSSSPRKVKSFKSGNILSAVDTNADLRSRRSSSHGEGLGQNTRNTQISKSKDITRRKRWT